LVGLGRGPRRGNAELYVMPEATHYAPVEYPELVNARIDAFLSASNGAVD
jgi:pimeloyl-ACP methyl ester carboxylesterase